MIKVNKQTNKKTRRRSKGEIQFLAVPVRVYRIDPGALKGPKMPGFLQRFQQGGSMWASPKDDLLQGEPCQAKCVEEKRVNDRHVEGKRANFGRGV